MRRAVHIPLLFAALTATSPARAADPSPSPTPSSSSSSSSSDPWFGEDKALHFAASAAIAAGGYAAGAALFDARWKALALGGGLAVAAGLGKEAFDLAGHGDPSLRDLAWDGLGTVAGLALAWGLDLLVRGAGDAHPALAAPPPARARAAAFTIAF